MLLLSFKTYKRKTEYIVTSFGRSAWNNCKINDLKQPDV